MMLKETNANLNTAGLDAFGKSVLAYPLASRVLKIEVPEHEDPAHISLWQWLVQQWPGNFVCLFIFAVLFFSPPASVLLCIMLFLLHIHSPKRPELI